MLKQPEVSIRPNQAEKLNRKFAKNNKSQIIQMQKDIPNKSTKLQHNSQKCQ